MEPDISFSADSLIASGNEVSEKYQTPDRQEGQEWSRTDLRTMEAWTSGNDHPEERRLQGDFDDYVKGRSNRWLKRKYFEVMEPPPKVSDERRANSLARSSVELSSTSSSVLKSITSDHQILPGQPNHEKELVKPVTSQLLTTQKVVDKPKEPESIMHRPSSSQGDSHRKSATTLPAVQQKLVEISISQEPAPHKSEEKQSTDAKKNYSKPTAKDGERHRSSTASHLPESKSVARPELPPTDIQTESSSPASHIPQAEPAPNVQGDQSSHPAIAPEFSRPSVTPVTDHKKKSKSGPKNLDSRVLPERSAKSYRKESIKRSSSPGKPMKHLASSELTFPYRSTTSVETVPRGKEIGDSENPHAAGYITPMDNEVYPQDVVDLLFSTDNTTESSDDLEAFYYVSADAESDEDLYNSRSLYSIFSSTMNRVAPKVDSPDSPKPRIPVGPQPVDNKLIKLLTCIQSCIESYKNASLSAQASELIDQSKGNNDIDSHPQVLDIPPMSTNSRSEMENDVQTAGTGVENGSKRTRVVFVLPKSTSLENDETNGTNSLPISQDESTPRSVSNPKISETSINAGELVAQEMAIRLSVTPAPFVGKSAQSSVAVSLSKSPQTSEPEINKVTPEQYTSADPTVAVERYNYNTRGQKTLYNFSNVPNTSVSLKPPRHYKSTSPDTASDESKGFPLDLPGFQRPDQKNEIIHEQRAELSDDNNDVIMKNMSVPSSFATPAPRSRSSCECMQRHRLFSDLIAGMNSSFDTTARSPCSEMFRERDGDDNNDVIMKNMSVPSSFAFPAPRSRSPCECMQRHRLFSDLIAGMNRSFDTTAKSPCSEMFRERGEVHSKIEEVLKIMCKKHCYRKHCHLPIAQHVRKQRESLFDIVRRQMANTCPCYPFSPCHCHCPCLNVPRSRNLEAPAVPSPGVSNHFVRSSETINVPIQFNAVSSVTLPRPRHFAIDQPHPSKNSICPTCHQPLSGMKAQAHYNCSSSNHDQIVQDYPPAPVLPRAENKSFIRPSAVYPPVNVHRCLLDQGQYLKSTLLRGQECNTSDCCALQATSIASNCPLYQSAMPSRTYPHSDSGVTLPQAQKCQSLFCGCLRAACQKQMPRDRPYRRRPYRSNAFCSLAAKDNPTRNNRILVTTQMKP